MAKQSSPLYLRLLKIVAAPIVTLKQKMSGNQKPLTLESIPEKAQVATISDEEPNPTHWVLAETSDKDDKNRNVVVVQVEAFPNTSLSTEQLILKNYTIDGEDPNLRITHYPSNRLH